MARIQFDVITMLVKKLLVGQTRSISGPILRWRNFTLPIFSILYENNLLFTTGKDFVQITLWYTKTTPDVPLCEATTTLISWRPPQIRYWISNDIVHNTSNQYTNVYGAASQWNSMPSNQCLVQKKYQSDCFWTCVLYFAVECEKTRPKVISTGRNIFQKEKHLHTPPNFKNRINEIYSIFLPVVYHLKSITKTLLSLAYLKCCTDDNTMYN